MCSAEVSDSSDQSGTGPPCGMCTRKATQTTLLPFVSSLCGYCYWSLFEHGGYFTTYMQKEEKKIKGVLSKRQTLAIVLFEIPIYLDSIGTEETVMLYTRDLKLWNETDTIPFLRNTK